MKGVERLLIIGASIDNCGQVSSVCQGIKGCEVIGNYKSGFSEGEIANLQGRISENAIIDIYAHGSVNDDVHRIRWSDEVSSDTRDLLVKLSRIADNKHINVNLRSCLGGAAIADASYLPKGSTLVTHVKHNAYSIGRLEDLGIESSLKCHRGEGDKHSPFSEYLNALPFNSVQTSSFAISNGPGVEPSIYNIDFNSSDALLNSEVTLKNAQAQFVNFAKDNGVDINPQKMTEYEINIFRNGHLNYALLNKDGSLLNLVALGLDANPPIKSVILDNYFGMDIVYFALLTVQDKKLITEVVDAGFDINPKVAGSNLSIFANGICYKDDEDEDEDTEEDKEFEGWFMDKYHHKIDFESIHQEVVDNCPLKMDYFYEVFGAYYPVLDA